MSTWRCGLVDLRDAASGKLLLSQVVYKRNGNNVFLYIGKQLCFKNKTVLTEYADAFLRFDWYDTVPLIALLDLCSQYSSLENCYDKNGNIQRDMVIQLFNRYCLPRLQRHNRCDIINESLFFLEHFKPKMVKKFYSILKHAQ